MRRIALLAGVTATLAGGAAALAAAPDPAAPGAATPDPYQGRWALTLDGKPAGPIARVDGCSLRAQIVVNQSGGQNPTGKHVAAVTPEPCSIEFGGGMSAAFNTMLNDALAGRVSRHSVQIVRTDPEGGYAFDLADATITSVTVPKLDRASLAPVSLKATLNAARVRRVAGVQMPIPKAVAISPRGLAVQVNGRPLYATSVGPWTVSIKPADSVGEARDYALVPSQVELGALPIRVGELDRKGTDTILGPWVDSLTRGIDDERTLSVSAGGFKLTLDHAGLQRADLAARADGARSYDLYSEQAGITAG